MRGALLAIALFTACTFPSPDVDSNTACNAPATCAASAATCASMADTASQVCQSMCKGGGVKEMMCRAQCVDDARQSCADACVGCSANAGCANAAASCKSLAGLTQ